jgi:outer membrane protein TolC
VRAIASVPLFTSGRISHNVDAAQANVQASQANQASTSSELKLQITQSYLNVLRAQSALTLAQQTVESLQAHAHEVEQRYQQGLVAKNDALAASVAQLNASQTVMQATNQLDYAKSHYNQLLNRQLTTAVNLEPYQPKLPQGSLDNLTQTAIANRYELLALAKQMNALSEQASGVKAELLPQVALNSGYAYQENRYQANQGLWQAGVEMQWKLDASTTPRAAALSKQLAALKEQREDLANQISLQVRSAWLETQETEQRIKVTAQTITQSQENYRITKDRYAQGLATHSEVLQAQALNSQSQDANNNAHYDYALAISRLRRAVELL